MFVMAVRALVLAGVLGLALVAAIGPAAAPSAAAGTRVTVNMTDFRFTLSRSSVTRGNVSFKVVNNGKVIHDFKIAGKKTPIYRTGQRGTLQVRFTKAGRYRYICTVPGHVAAGMSGSLRVR